MFQSMLLQLSQIPLKHPLTLEDYRPFKQEDSERLMRGGKKVLPTLI